MSLNGRVSRWLAGLRGLSSALSFRGRLALVVAVGLLLRLVWFALLWDGRLILDEPEYLALARAVRAGGYLDDGRWLRPPLYPLWLALTLGPGDSVFLARLVQVALSTVLIVLLSRVALALWQDERIALVTGLLTAVYLPLIAFANYLMAETLLLVLLGGVFLVLVRLVQSPTWWRAALAGVLLGLALLAKPVAQACVPALLVAVWLCQIPWRTRLSYLLLAGVCSVVVVAPWTIRNAIVHQRFIPLDTTGGYNLWFGNHPPDQGGSIFEERMQQAYPNPGDRNRAYAALAWENAAADPGYTLGVLARKARMVLRTQADVLATQQYGDLVLACPPKYSLKRVEDSGEHFGQLQRHCWWKWFNVTADMVYLPMLVGGLCAALWVRQSRAMVVGWVWVGCIVAVTIVTQAQPRLRLPVVIVMLPFAAAGLLACVARWRHYVIIQSSSVWQGIWHSFAQHWRPRVALVAVLVGGWVVSLLPLGISLVLGSLGGLAWQTGTPTLAYNAYRAAAAVYPTHTSMLLAAGQTAETLGHDNTAMNYYRQVTDVVYYEPQARIGLARLLQHHGDTHSATEVLHGSALSSRQLEQVGFASPLLPPEPYKDVGGPAATDYGYVLGLHPADTSENSPTFRWSRAQAAIRLGTLPTPAGVLRIRLSTTHPEGDTPHRLNLLVNGMPMTQLSLTPGWWRVYSVVVPPTQHGVVLSIETDTFLSTDANHTDASAREIGVAIDWVSFEPFSYVPHGEQPAQ